MTAAAIQFREVSLRLANARLLLHELSLEIQTGATTALLGRSGSGKTTLLRMVNRMLEPTSGEILVHGLPLHTQEAVQLRRSIGYVIQETGLFPHLNVMRNVSIVPELKGESKAMIKGRATQLLRTVGLDPEQFAERMPHELSGGQRQRVGLARALAAEPAILLMDEPFGALDPLTRAEMQDVLLKLLAEMPKTVLLVTHDLDEALYMASRIVLVEQGRVVADLAAEDFLGSSIPAVQEYVKAVHRGTMNRVSAHGEPPTRGSVDREDANRSLPVTCDAETIH